VLAAPLGALLIWLVAVPAVGLDLTAGADARPITAITVVVVATVAGLAATGLAMLLSRRTSRPRRSWLIVAGAVLLLSLTGPLSATSAGVGVTLVAMHLLVGAIVIIGIGGTVNA
jgi:hypothetical protein